MQQSNSTIPINFKKPEISNYENNEAQKWIERLSSKLQKVSKLEKIEISTNEVKNTKSEPELFQTSIRIQKDGKNFYAKANGETFLISLNAAIKKIESQELKEQEQKSATGL